MGFNNIDARGHAFDRRGIRAIQRTHGKVERLAAAQARRDARRAKRAGASAVLFFPWPVGGVARNEPDGAYAQGPNGSGKYQVVVVGTPKGEADLYRAAVSKWVGLELEVLSAEPLARPTIDDDPTRPFLSIILAPANGR